MQNLIHHQNLIQMLRLGVAASLMLLARPPPAWSDNLSALRTDVMDYWLLPAGCHHLFKAVQLASYSK
jgi:hypothetical protein